MCNFNQVSAELLDCEKVSPLHVGVVDLEGDGVMK
jgi:hypothetical protein